MSNKKISRLEVGLENIWLPYTQMQTTSKPMLVDSTHGSKINLVDGSILIDGMASWWTACHGYNHPHIQKAVQKQLEKMPHIMFGGLAHEPALSLAHRLTSLLPKELNKVFFSESGSVSVEVAIKMAIQYWFNMGERKRKKIISFYGAYHGDTSAAMSVCDPEEGMHSVFNGAIPEQYILKLPTNDKELKDFVSFVSMHAKECAAVIVEPLVQGAGGMRMHEPQVLQRLRETCDEYDLILIFDEIFTGFGRTGNMFAFESAGISPDILTLSKALTGGTVPLAATVASNQIFEGFLDNEQEKALMHGPTYMANPIACAAANASLDLFEEEPRLEQVREISDQLSEQLSSCSSIDGVVDVRVLGAIGVVEISGKIQLDLLRSMFVEEGVWVRPFGNIIYLTPSFTISKDELTHLTDSINRVISKWARG